jgi:DNA-binding NarL/FixJ family response regulator
MLEDMGGGADVAVLVLSQYVETRYAAQLLSGRCEGVGYLLKDRVADVSDFLDALTRVAAGATVLDPEVFDPGHAHHTRA